MPGGPARPFSSTIASLPCPCPDPRLSPTRSPPLPLFGHCPPRVLSLSLFLSQCITKEAALKFVETEEQHMQALGPGGDGEEGEAAEEEEDDYADGGDGSNAAGGDFDEDMEGDD